MAVVVPFLYIDLEARVAMITDNTGVRRLLLLVQLRRSNSMAVTPRPAKNGRCLGS